MKKILLYVALVSLLLVKAAYGQVCPVAAGTELVTNGNFESGLTGFASDYPIATGSPPSFGTGGAGIWTNPNDINAGFFADMGDHTSGTGNMFVVDVDGVLGKDVYRTDVTVAANTTYFFSVWFANINLTTTCGACNNPGYTPPAGCAVPTDCSPAGKQYENTPELRFSINGTPVGSLLKADSTNHKWSQFYYVWKSGAISGLITLRIENMVPSGQGNDLAIDDISFSTGCDKIANLNQYGNNSVMPDTVYACNVSFPYNLNTALANANYTFQWRDNSTAIIGGATSNAYNVNTAPAGNTKYYVCYDSISDGINGCYKTDSVLIIVSPLQVNLGADKVMCPPVNIVLNSGVNSPPVTVQWQKDGTPVATTADYTATDVGTYSVNISRAGCGAASDNMVISSPTSTISGNGTYCVSSNTAVFNATGSDKIKWYTVGVGGTPLNPSNYDSTITLAYTSTNTSTLGCSSGLYAEDNSSFTATAMPTAPCSGNNTNGVVDLMIEINQTLTLNSFDFYHNAGWGATGTFVFSILDNNPSGGPWCGGCSPAGNKDGAGSTVLYTETSPGYTVSGSNTVRTFSLASPQTLTPGKYWLRLQAVNTALGVFDGCTPSFNSGGTWTTPYVDDTGFDFMMIEKSIYNGNAQSTGAMFNFKIQVGAINLCKRTFICAASDCALPLELLDFFGVAEINKNIISWSVVPDNNNECNMFKLESSLDGINFNTLTTVNCSPNNQSNYSYMDNTNSPITYYRIIQIDNNGDHSYSQVIALNKSLDGDIRVYPSPVSNGGTIFIETNNLKDNNIQIEIIDLLGKTSEVKICSKIVKPFLSRDCRGVKYCSMRLIVSKIQNFYGQCPFK